MGMNTNLFLPGDEMIDMALAEFLGYFWCRYLDGMVVGQRIVRFLVSPQQFEAAKKEYGASGIILASKEEPIEQLAFRAVPAFHSSRDEMAKIETRFYQMNLHDLYRMKLRELVCQQATGLLSDLDLWHLITAEPSERARAAFLAIDGQRPRQQTLFG